jgi:hypothetical protein
MVQPPQDDSHLRKDSAEYAAMLRAQARSIEDEAWDAPEPQRVRLGAQADRLKAEAERIEETQDNVILF